MSELWRILHEVEHPTIVPIINSSAPARKAVFIGTEGMDEMSAEILSHHFHRLGWSTFQVGNFQSVREKGLFDLNIFVLASQEAAAANEGSLKLLYQQGTMGVVIIEDSQVNVPFPILEFRSGVPGSFVLKLLHLCLDVAGRGVELSAASIHEGCGGDVLLHHGENVSATLGWGSVPQDPVTFSCLASLPINASELVDGRYVGGLLKNAMPAARIRLLIEQVAWIVLQPNSHEHIQPIDIYQGRLQDACTNSQIPVSPTIRQANADAIYLTVPGKDGKRVAEALKSNELKISEFSFVSVSFCFRFELTAPLRAFLLCEALRRMKVPEPRLQIKLEDLGAPQKTPIAAPAPTPQPQAAHQSQPQQQHSQQGLSAEPPIVGPPPPQVAQPQHQAQLPPLAQPSTRSQSQQSAASQPPPPPPPLPPLPVPDVTPQLVVLKAENEMLKKQLDELHSHHKAEMERVQTQFRLNLDEEKAARERDISNVMKEIQTLREKAADHVLVERAISEVKSQYDTLETAAKKGFGEDASRIRSLMDTVEQLTRSVREVAHSPRRTTEVEETAFAMEQRIRAVDEKTMEFGARANLLQRAMEAAINKLHAQITFVDSTVNELRMQHRHLDQRQTENEFQIQQSPARQQPAPTVQHMSSADTEELRAELSDVKKYTARTIEQLAERMTRFELELETLPTLQQTSVASPPPPPVQAPVDIEPLKTAIQSVEQECDELMQRVMKLESFSAEIAGLVESEKERSEKFVEMENVLSSVQQDVEAMRAAAELDI